MTSELLHIETEIVQAQHYDVIDGIMIAWSKRLARRGPVGISLALKTGNVATLRLFFIKTAVATILTYNLRLFSNYIKRKIQ